MNLYVNEKMFSSDVHYANTFIKRLRGYMFHEKPHYEVLVFEPCNSIHTFFMRFNIDVLFLDSEGLVLEKRQGLEKNKMIAPIKDVVFTVEAIEGKFDSIHIGDIVKIW